MLKPTTMALAMLAALACGDVALAQSAPPTPTPHWVGTWGAPPAFPNGPEVTNETVREVVRLSLGGRAVRIRLSNEMGTAPLVIGAAHLAKPGTVAGGIDPASDHVLTFGGRPGITIPPGAPALSDPVSIAVQPLDSLAVSLFVPRDTGPSATHPLGRATTYLAEGDRTGAETLPDAKTDTARYFLSGVEVDAPGASTVVTLGDSITDGYGSTLDENRRWPDVLAERLAAAHVPMGVVDAGISGNRVLHDLPEALFGPAALARLDRDVLAVPGAAAVIVMESINDIGHPTSAALPEQAVSADDIAAGLRQIADRAHAHGLKVYGATLTPFTGTVFPGYFSAEGEEKRQAVNSFIRTGGAFDGVIDFDAVVRDPDHPERLRAAYDFGDHLHPNNAGYKAMGEAIDLALVGGK